MFYTTISFMSKSSEHVSEQAGEHVSEHGETKNHADKLLEFCEEPKTRQEIQEFLEIMSRS